MGYATTLAPNPTYSAPTTTWAIGHPAYTTNGTNRNLVGTTQGWALHLNPMLGLTVGMVMTFTEAQFCTSNMSTTGVNEFDKVSFCVYSLPTAGTTFTKELEVDITSLVSNSASTATQTTALSGSLTIATGKTYYWGIGIRGASGHTTSKPAIRSRTTNQPTLSYWWATNPLNVGGATLPSTATTASADGSPGSNGNYLIGQVKFTTTTKKVASYGSASSRAFSGTTLRHILPHRLDGTYHITFRNAKVSADGSTMTTTFQDDNGNSGSPRVTGTWVMDFGATDQMTYGGSNAALNGSVSEANNNFDVSVEMRDNSTSVKSDLFYVNTSTAQGLGTGDRVTFSQHAKAGGTYSSAGYTLAASAQPIGEIALTGANGLVDTIEIATERICYLGDSMLGSGQGASNRIANYFAAQLSNPGSEWQMAKANRRLARDLGSITSMKNLYRKDSAVGPGLTNMSNTLFVLHGGGNDMDEGNLTSEADLNQTRGDMAEAMGFILHDIFDVVNGKNNRALIYGMPPMTNNFDNWRKDAFLSWSDTLSALAIGARCHFYHPYDVALANYEAIGHDPAVGAYQESDGIHYTEPLGSTVMAAAGANAYQNNLTGTLIHQGGSGGSTRRSYGGGGVGVS